MAPLTLVIGNRNYSSWSLRAWFALKHLGLPFREIVIQLDTPDTREQLERAFVTAAGALPFPSCDEIRQGVMGHRPQPAAETAGRVIRERAKLLSYAQQDIRSHVV